MAKLTIYNGSYTEIKMPEIRIHKYYKDFGLGFYCTILKELARKWANKYDTPVVNIYEYNENKDLKVKEFGTMSEEWLDFIIDSRNGKKHDYDIVIGAMAYDQIYNYIQSLMDNIITREAFWKLVKFKCPTHQIAFCTKDALDTLVYVGKE